ncbi:MAG: addiction module protein [Chitinophagaceae bacterium]
MSITKEKIQSLSKREREELLAMLWDVIEEKDYEDLLPQETTAELSILQERLEEYKKNPGAAINWDDFYKQESQRINNAKKGN